jgi:hypothetical protein
MLAAGIAGGVCLLSFLAWHLLGGAYWRYFSTSYLTQSPWRNLLGHLLEAGELVTNLSRDSLPRPYHAVFIMAGLAGLCAALPAFRARIRDRSRPVEAYVAAFVLIVSVWPYSDTRFWLPVLPLLAVYAVRGASSAWRRPGVRVASALYLALFAGTGIAALASSTRTSWSGPGFPDRCGETHLRTTYRVAFGLGDGKERDVNRLALDLLRRYEGRARPGVTSGRVK